MFDRLKWAASTGLGLSPGDPVAAWAVTEIKRLRALLTPPDTIGHTHEWTAVSALGGPRMRCNGCGFLGLPADETKLSR